MTKIELVDRSLLAVAVAFFLGCGCAYASTGFEMFLVCAAYWGGLVVHHVDLVTRYSRR